MWQVLTTGLWKAQDAGKGQHRHAREYGKGHAGMENTLKLEYGLEIISGEKPFFPLEIGDCRAWGI